MKASQFYISTLKEAPADAEVASHKLMMRAGMIKKLGAGIYSYMPMGLRVIRKVEVIVREEMNRAGAVEISMPVVQPAELWQESGRFSKMGPELLRIQDRHERDYIVQPTSEEVVTDIARQDIKSYKQLPVNLYQIQTKFRDERRPRFGLMRGREFTMKDAYSFDKDVACAKDSYQVMARAYRRIFDRFGLRYRAVAADSGAIGGDLSEEFQVIAATGEDAIVYCAESDYAANMEKAEALAPQAPRRPPSEAMAKTATPGKSTCADVADYLGVPLQRTVKSLVLATELKNEQGQIVKTQVWLLMLRGDHDLNEVKANKLPGMENGFRFATLEEIDTHFGCKPGYLGLINMRKPVRVVVDREVAVMSDWICGANEPDFHITGVNWGRDLPEPELVADLRNVVAGDASPDGKGILAIERGIEIGHVFYLGTKYSRAMNATFLDPNGKPQFMEMGCYGIGITRLPAAAIEQNHDERGIIWPDALAPFTVVLCPISPDRFPEVKLAADKLHGELLNAGVDVILDDRGERPGAMFADWELIGVPHRITIGDRGLKEGQLEYQHRRDAAATKLAIGDVFGFITSRLGEMSVLARPDKYESGLAARRSCLLSMASGLGLFAIQLPARAGGQLEEPLVDSVRTALSAAIANSAPPEPKFPDTVSYIRYLSWLGAMSERLKRRKPDLETRKEFLKTVWYESKRSGLETTLVLGLIQVESAFRKFAVSSVGARGYMQVMPFWTRVLGAEGDASRLFHVQTNLRFGCVILRHYLDRENGNLFMALGRYNGSRGKAPYPQAVLEASRQWEFKPA